MKLINPQTHLRKHCTAAAAALTLGILSTSSLSAQVVAGLDTWDSTTAPTVSVVAPGVTATATASATGGSWSNTDGAGRGSSKDGTWGTFNAGVGASTVTDVGSANFTATNGKTDAEVTLTIVNNGAVDLDLAQFNMDVVAFRPNAPRAYALNVLAGSDITVGNVFTSADDEITHLGGGLLTDDLDPATHDQHDDIDIDLTGLADATLEVGGTAIIQIAFSSGTGAGGGHHLFLDNVAVTTAPTATDKLAVTAVPVASVTAGTDFSVTIQAQDSGGTPINVIQDTDVSITSNGVGALTGTTGTILMGTDSVTLATINGTVAETITFTASRTSGDDLLPSAPSASVTIDPDAATAFFVETAIDGSGTSVGPTNMLVGDILDVFAITRDTYGNFVENDPTALFDLVNITGGILATDLIDNGNGSASFEAFDLGTANIRGMLSSFPDVDTGLITVEELTSTWTRGGGNSSWNTAANWLGSVLPNFDDQTDLIFYDPAADDGGFVNVYMADPRTTRSLTYNKHADANFNIRTTISGTTGVADLTFDTDSVVDPAEINIDADATGTFKLGNISTDPAREHGHVVLADNLLITHNGTGTLNIDATISEIGGSYGITKTGPGTAAFTAVRGANTYTGTSTVNDGILQVNGDSIPADLVIEGTGVVDVTGTEYVSSLQLGGGAVQMSGTFDAISDPTYISGAGQIVVGSPPVGSDIVISDISVTGVDEVTVTFTSGTNVDIYSSTDPNSFIWSVLDSDQPTGTYIHSGASFDQNYYLLLPTGSPAP